MGRGIAAGRFQTWFLSEEDRARPGHALRLPAPRSARRLIITDQDRRGLLFAVPKSLIYHEATSAAKRIFAASASHEGIEVVDVVAGELAAHDMKGRPFAFRASAFQRARLLSEIPGGGGRIQPRADGSRGRRLIGENRFTQHREHPSARVPSGQAGDLQELCLPTLARAAAGARRDVRHGHIRRTRREDADREAGRFLRRVRRTR